MTTDTRNHIQALFEKQQAHRARMARTTPAERQAILSHFKAALRQHRPALVEALAADLGKSRTEAEVTELHQVFEGLNLALRQVERWMKPRRVPTSPVMVGLRAQVVPEPKGTVLILGPWNYPVTNLLSPFVEALAAGNTVMLKPSEKAPATAHAIRELVEATFEPQLVAVVEGDAGVAQILTHLPFDHILFTGSTAVGRKVMEAASTNLTPVTLELGGKSPVVIDRSADLKLAADRVVWGKLMNVGQTCIAPDYALVPREYQDEFVGHLSAAMKKMYGEGEWLRQNPDLGRLIDPASVRRLQELTEKSLSQGARLVIGGDFDPEGRFISPTVVQDVTRAMPLMSQELFGPILPVLPYDDLDTALHEINLGPTPLALYAFGKASATDHIRRSTRSGGLVVNGTIIHITNHSLPFGGRGASGMGQYHGKFGFDTFSHMRGMVTEPRLSPVIFNHPPFSALGARVAQRLLALAE